ncbi:MAG: glutamate racemase [Pyrinomonadaceae bacterium]
MKHTDTQNRELPIGIFDSGVGGLTVYRALREQLPHEQFIYLGDTARVPYGTKSLATVERYAVENALFLVSRGIKILVVACNTASALALPCVRECARVPTLGVIEAGARAAVETTRARSIGVIATEATVQSQAYTRAIKRLAPEMEIIERACPLFVPLAEEGEANSDIARMVAEKYMRNLRGTVDALILGCTHYPLLHAVIQETIGDEVHLIDSGEAVTRDVLELLAHENLARENSDPDFRDSTTNTPRKFVDEPDQFYVTDAADRFARVAERFLGNAPAKLEAVEVWGHDELIVKSEK